MQNSNTLLAPSVKPTQVETPRDLYLGILYSTEQHKVYGYVRYVFPYSFFRKVSIKQKKININWLLNVGLRLYTFLIYKPDGQYVMKIPKNTVTNIFSRK